MPTYADEQGLHCNCGSINLQVIIDENSTLQVKCIGIPDKIHTACHISNLSDVINNSSLVPDPQKATHQSYKDYVLDENLKQKISFATYNQLVNVLHSSIKNNPTIYSKAIQQLQSILLTPAQIATINSEI